MVMYKNLAAKALAAKAEKDRYQKEIVKLCPSNVQDIFNTMTLGKETALEKVTIGGITVQSEAQQLILLSGDDDLILQAIKGAKGLKGGNGTGIYRGLVPTIEKVNGRPVRVYKISEKEIRRITNEMAHAAITPENCKKFLEDLDHVYRYYQEIKIDSAKTGDIIKIEVGVVGFRPYFQAEIQMVQTGEDDDEIEYKRVFKNEYNVETGKGTVYFKDVISVMQDELIDVLDEGVKFSKSEEGFLLGLPTNVVDEAHEIYKLLPTTLETAKTYYGRIAVESVMISNAIRAMGHSEDIEEALLKEVNDAKKHKLSLVRIMARQALDGLTSVEKFYAGIAVSHRKAGVFNRLSKNKFVENIFDLESIEYFYSLEDHNLCGYRIVKGKKYAVEGESYYFEDGICYSDSIIMDTKGEKPEVTNGEYEIRKIDGVLYAVQEVEFNNVDNKIDSERAFALRYSTEYNKIEDLRELIGEEVTVDKAGRIFASGADEEIAYVQSDKKGTPANYIGKTTVDLCGVTGILVSIEEIELYKDDEPAGMSYIIHLVDIEPELGGTLDSTIKIPTVTKPVAPVTNTVPPVSNTTINTGVDEDEADDEFADLDFSDFADIDEE